MKTNSIYIAIFLLFCQSAIAQTDSIDSRLPLQVPLPHYDCINYSANHLRHSAATHSLQHFYAKMDSLALFGGKKINIVYIGGSHIQADILTDRLRQNIVSIQPSWDGSRGSIFPYKAARTNNPPSYIISHTGSWTKTQNSLPPVTEPLGINGIAITTYDTNATVSFNLNPGITRWHYTHLRLFALLDGNDFWPMLLVGDDTIPAQHDGKSYIFCLKHSAHDGTIIIGRLSECDKLFAKYNDEHTAEAEIEWLDSGETMHLIPIRNKNTSVEINDSMLNTNQISTDSLDIGMENDNGSFVDPILIDSLSAPPPRITCKFTIQGMIASNGHSGCTVNALGVNGASLPSWLRCAHFENQIGYLAPDLMILGVGVNDANVAYGDFDTEIYKSRYRELIKRVKHGNPHCDIIFVTNNDCIYRIGRKSKGGNRNSALVQRAMYELAAEYGAAIWDLYEIMGGFGSVDSWVKAGLSRSDKIHFTTSGYNLLGDMLFNAIVENWLYNNGTNK